MKTNSVLNRGEKSRYDSIKWPVNTHMISIPLRILILVWVFCRMTFLSTLLLSLFLFLFNHIAETPITYQHKTTSIAKRKQIMKNFVMPTEKCFITILNRYNLPYYFSSKRNCSLSTLKLCFVFRTPIIY